MPPPRRVTALDGPHLGDFGYVMPQQILNAVPQRRRRRWAARAGALHVQIDDAVLEAAEGDVAAVIGDRGPYPRFDQILDGGDGLGIGRLEELAAVARLGLAARQQRLAGHEVLHDGAEDHRLELLPLAV